MKRIVLSLVAVFFVFVGGSIIYHFHFSIPAVLHEHRFYKKDIIASEDYLSYPDPKKVMKIVLVADEDKIGLMMLMKNNVGFWTNAYPSSIVNQPLDGELITVGFARMAMENGEVHSDKHIYVAYFVEDEKKIEISSPQYFDLMVDYFDVNDRVLLFAHATAIKESFSSEEVTSYLQSNIK